MSDDLTRRRISQRTGTTISVGDRVEFEDGRHYTVLSIDPDGYEGHEGRGLVLLPDRGLVVDEAGCSLVENFGVRRSPSGVGWQWNAGHDCTYVCGAGGCDGRGWRPTRRWAARALRRWTLSHDRRRWREEQGWNPPASTEQPLATEDDL